MQIITIKVNSTATPTGLIDAIRALPILDLYDYKLTLTDDTPTTK